jgi:hypothetical protein
MRFIPFFLLLSVVTACSNEPPRPVVKPPKGDPRLPATPPPKRETSVDALDDPTAAPEAVKAAIEAQRKVKDTALKNSDESPIPAAERAKFNGLKYFGFDPKYRFVCKLTPCTSNAPIKMTATKPNDDRVYRCFGVLNFTVDGVPCSLMALKMDSPAPFDDSSELFVPFQDTTSGKETYGAGRYINLEQNESGQYVLDFNRAFNPYCAYNPNFSCPLPPPENVLKVAIRAGELPYH